MLHGLVLILFINFILILNHFSSLGGYIKLVILFNCAHMTCHHYGIPSICESSNEIKCNTL
jgi:hypothetical protein